MITGWTLLGVVYLLTAGATALTVSLDGYDPYGSSCGEFTPCYPDPPIPARIKLLYVPMVGPFLAIPVGETYGTRLAIAFPGVLQLGALAMGIVGTVQYVRDGRDPRVVGANGFRLSKRLHLGVVPTRLLDGGTLPLGGRF
jgi:hypothetical protein